MPAKLYFVICLLYVILFFTSCKKEKTVYKPLDPVLKAQYYFKAGSYWIMADSATGNTDSFAVVNAVDNFPDGGAVAYEQAIVDIRRYSLTSADSIISAMSIYLREVDNLQLILQEYHDSVYKIYNYAPVPFPFHDTAFIYFQQPQDTVDIRTVNNVNTGGQSYNCYQINFRNTYQRSTVAFRFSDDFYINPDVGLVRITLRHVTDPVSRDWKLLRYHIQR